MLERTIFEDLGRLITWWFKEVSVKVLWERFEVKGGHEPLTQ